MRAPKTLTTLALSALGALAILAPAAQGAPAPAWQVSLNSHPTNFEPGSESPATGRVFPEYVVIAENVGGASSSGPITITVQLPTGIAPAAAREPSGSDQSHNTVATNETTCSVPSPQTVTCTDLGRVDPGEWVKMEVPVDVADLPDPTTLGAQATISGGGGAAATTEAQTTVSDTIAPFGFLAGKEGLNASVVADDGSPATQAGAHPYQLNVNLGLPTQIPSGSTNGFPIPDGSLDDVKVDLPAGMVVDPSATPKCSEAQFASFDCPEAAQVGEAEIPIAASAIGVETSQIYNLEAPAGRPAAFGFYVLFVPVHVLGAVRPGDYRISSLTPDAVAALAVFNARLQLWGSPSEESHDRVRGKCRFGDAAEESCPVSRSEEPLLSLPTSCTESMRIDAHVSLWEEPGKLRDRDTELSDANGNPTEVAGCNQLHFSPTLRARPTTGVADSPTGLEAVLEIPQSDDVDELATAHLRKAVVTLPEGLAVNPASANGLAGCSSAQIGIDPNTGVPDGEPVKCPAASRIGRVEVSTPLLDHPLPGSVFVATPHDNPFDSLLAIYVVIDDQSTATLVKLAGHVVADPQTGQLSTTFDDNPQLPFAKLKLDFFGGATAPLRTPATCGTYETTSQMTPWSAPASGPPATPSDSWQVTGSPRGSCATSEAALPNSPSFTAGSVSPIAALHTPFVLSLRRDDATQQLSSVTLSPPPGLLAKLAGTTQCSEAALAQAGSKSGNEEKQSPSCPESSRIGSVEVGAGAGPAPYYAQGTAYLSGPYKGAPLSMAIITPATAGPYDLGTVVVRTAIHVDPASTEITAISDPIPEILAGIPLDVRSARVSLDRPDFTLNGTSCDPFAVQGTLLSTQSQSARLLSRYQLGECSRLAFKPKLSLRLKGGTRRTDHPKLIAILRAGEGEANLARAQVKLPPSAFLDQAHIKTICTRVQFAADQCPQGSIYGRAQVKTPLFDETFTGNVYLRSSSHNLPDLVLDLRGPADKPIRIEVTGRTDSVKGALRNTFEAVPDAPFTTARVELFGGKRGLVVNSRDLCAHRYRAAVKLTGHNGKSHEASPVVRADCGKQKRRKSARRVARR